MDGLWDPPSYGLWDPPNYGESSDSFCFPVPCDILEETALTEEICIQVLKILITNADGDINELEEELMDLMTRLASTNEEFSDMFSDFLRVKIDLLDLSVRKLKNGCQDFLSTNREPVVENLHDIMKTVYCQYVQKKDQKVCAENPSQKKKQVGCSSNANTRIEKSKRVIFIPLEKHTISETRVKIEKENTNYPASINNLQRITQVHKFTAEDLCQDSKKKTNIEVKKFQRKKPLMKKDNIVKNITPKCKSICQMPSLKTQDKWKNQLQMVKYQPKDESINLLYSSPEEPNGNQNSCTKVDFPGDDEQESWVVPVCSTNRPKRRCSQWASPQFLLEGPKPKSIKADDDVDYSRDMDYYTVDDLKAIARKRNLKGYYKLRKADLAKLLGITVTDGKRKRIKRESAGVVLVQKRAR